MLKKKPKAIQLKRVAAAVFFNIYICMEITMIYQSYMGIFCFSKIMKLEKIGK